MRAGRPWRGVEGLAPDALLEGLAQAEGRGQEVPEAARPRVAGEHVEELGDVLAERLAAREEPEVPVEPARPRVVVPGGQVAVAAQAVGILANHQAGLAVGLVADQAVDDVRAHVLERPRPADVGLLVEPGAQLHQHRHLLALLGGPGEGLGDRGRGAHAIQRHLDREHPGIAGRFLDEAGDVIEGVIRVVHEHVAGADGAPDVRRLLERRHRPRRQRAILEPRQVQRRVELHEVREGGEAFAAVEVRRPPAPARPRARTGRRRAARPRTAGAPPRPCGARGGPPRCSTGDPPPGGARSPCRRRGSREGRGRTGCRSPGRATAGGGGSPPRAG